MSRVGNSVIDLVGNTPLVKLNRLTGADDADVYLKLEFFNPGSSVKDRIALAMIEAAEKNGELKEEIIMPVMSVNDSPTCWNIAFTCIAYSSSVLCR